MGLIVKEKGELSSSSSTFSSGSQSQAKLQHYIEERFEAQPREIETLKALIVQITAAQPQPLPKDDEDFGRD